MKTVYGCNSDAKVEGFWSMYLYGPNGALKDERHGKNVVTTVGKEGAEVAVGNVGVEAWAGYSRPSINPATFLLVHSTSPRRKACTRPF